MSAKDCKRVVAVGLEILTKEKVKGVADVDVPEIVFDSEASATAADTPTTVMFD